MAGGSEKGKGGDMLCHSPPILTPMYGVAVCQFMLKGRGDSCVTTAAYIVTSIFN